MPNLLPSLNDGDNDGLLMIGKEVHCVEDIKRGLVTPENCYLLLVEPMSERLDNANGKNIVERDQTSNTYN